MSMADKWPSMDTDLVDRVDRLVSTMPVYRRKMFGTSAWFLDSNDVMFAGVWADGVTVKVGANEAQSLVKSGDAEQFDPIGGRPMKEIVFLDADRIAEDAELAEWLERAAAFTSTLPAKKKRPSKKR